ncbi:MAG: preprotein translocase subunit SecE [Parvularculaceae bacterium]
MAVSKKPRKKTSGATSVSTDVKAETAEAPAMKKNKVGPAEFLQQVRAEGAKVVWTTRQETIISTIMVLVMVMIMSAFFFSVDQVFRWIVPMVLDLN